MKALLIIGIPLVIVLLSYAFRERIDEMFPWFKGWRTIILNGLSAVLIGGGELIGYLAGFSWGSVFSTETAMWLTLGLNIANIALRTMTTTPVGEK